MTNRLALLLFAAAIVGCTSGQQDSNAPSPPEEVAEPTAPASGNRDPKGPDTYQVALDTTEGRVVIEVRREWAPRGADRFYRLVKEGFFDGAKFFRVVEGFVVQFGIAADPDVSAKWEDATILDDPVRESNREGYVTFATSGPNSRTTQVFINLADNTFLDTYEGSFAPFGKVVEGMDVVKKLYSGYGEGAPRGRGPEQSTITSRGNEYLEKEFPELDGVETARVVSENGQPVSAGEQPSTPEAAAGQPAPAEREEPAPAEGAE